MTPESRFRRAAEAADKCEQPRRDELRWWQTVRLSFALSVMIMTVIGLLLMWVLA